MLLDEILQSHKLDHSKHDTLIKKVANTTIISPNVLNIGMNAYYKIPDKGFKSGFVESDIDLLQLFFNSKEYPYVNDWREVNFNDSKLLLYEMKSNDTTRNYKKAMYQLQRSKNMIKRYTAYKEIDTFYAFNLGNSIRWRFEQVD